MKKILIIALGFALLQSCEKETTTDKEFELKYGATIMVNLGEETMNIEFNDLIEDSRCPENMNCISEGQATVLLRINNAYQVVLGTGGEYPSKVIYENKVIRLIELDYGKQKNQGKAKHYQLKLIVE